MDNEHVRRMKITLLVSSLASLGLMSGVAYHDTFLGEWREFQRQYGERLVATASTDNARSAARDFDVEYKQIYLPNLGRIDRCTTCHLGVENPAMADAPQPLRLHPGELLTHHPVDKFGCTICHQGQGRAVMRDQAHGWDADRQRVKHAETPLLLADTVYTSCSRCHYELDLFGGLQDLYTAEVGESKLPIDGGMLMAALPDAVAAKKGKQLVVENGCLGCHAYRGRGGTLGPDITYVGDKTVHDFDFTHVRGEHTVERWLFEHFMFPQEVSPATIMPDMGFTSQEAMQLAHYMMSLHRKSAPASHRPRPLHVLHHDLQPIRGDTLYAMFCSSCHGTEGRGTTMRTGLWPTDADPWGHEWDARDIVVEKREELDVVVPSLNHPDTLAVASDDYLRHVISRGRPGTKMIAWTEEGGLTDDEVTLLVDHLRGWSRRAPPTDEISSARGDPRVGGALFRANCSTCHGVDGAGGIGVSLRSPTFLAVASDAFLRDSILHGRPNTAMPAWRQFDAQELSDLLAFIRRWQPRRASVRRSLELAAGGGTPDVSARIGQTLYAANCVMCHGLDGRGDLGPSLNTPEFLSAIPDEYLVTTLIEGRPGTAMPSWRHRSDEDIASIVRYLRSWQTTPSGPAPGPQEETPRGDSDAGRLLFVQICSGCHGRDGEGATGPQLNNPVFLRTASDRMLTAWIRGGKSGTEMRPFRKGGQGVAELSDRQIGDIVAFLRSLERAREGSINRVAKSPHGRPEKGWALYARNCSGCHGSRGEGASGPALSNHEFLRAASDGFLMATLALGRSGTQMRPVKAGPQSILQLTSDEVNDVVAYLRSWEERPPFESPMSIPHRFVIPWDLERGRQLYVSNCSGCHGVEGRGAWAPELNNEGFLTAATDGFLQATIVRGRKGTAMRPFGRGSHGLVDLSSDDVDNIVAYIRSWSKRTPSPMTIPAERSLEKPATPPQTSTAMRPPEAGNDRRRTAIAATFPVQKEHKENER